jgi:hypothetical protein
MTNVFSMLESSFDYVPPFKLEDFFTPNLAVDRKASFLLQLIAFVKTKHSELLVSPDSISKSASAKQIKSVTFRKGDSFVEQVKEQKGGIIESASKKVSTSETRPPVHQGRPP